MKNAKKVVERGEAEAQLSLREFRCYHLLI